MNFRKVTAIIRNDVLEKVEGKLRTIGVKGVSVTKVKGFGEYSNFYSKDWLVTHARIEIFAHVSNAEVIAQAVMEAAHVGLEGDGLVAVLPVEKVYRIRTKTEAGRDDL